MKRWYSITAVLLCLALTGTAQAAGPPTDLTVGDQARPLNVEGTPQFGWMPSSSMGNDVQTAYQLTVANGASTVWDSGKVASSAQSYVPYGGPALDKGEAYTWSVKTWGRDGEASPAATGHFETGLTDQGWSGAQWIRRVTTGNDSSDDYTLARKRFPALTTSPITRARVYASGMGNYEVFVNGRSIGRGDNFNHRARRSTTRSTRPTRSRPVSRSRLARSTTTGPAPARGARTARSPTRRSPRPKHPARPTSRWRA